MTSAKQPTPLQYIRQIPPNIHNPILSIQLKEFNHFVRGYFPYYLVQVLLALSTLSGYIGEH